MVVCYKCDIIKLFVEVKFLGSIRENLAQHEKNSHSPIRIYCHIFLMVTDEYVRLNIYGAYYTSGYSS